MGLMNTAHRAGQTGEGIEDSPSGHGAFNAVYTNGNSYLPFKSWGDCPINETFEQTASRRIRFWEDRPMDEDQREIVSPADARLFLGPTDVIHALDNERILPGPRELLGPGNEQWSQAFTGGDCAVFQVFSDRYPYLHTPVAGRVVDAYEIASYFSSGKSRSATDQRTSCSSHRRYITIFETDLVGATGAGYVAMIETGSSDGGSVAQCYSWDEYNYPKPPAPGMFLEKGRPKALLKGGGGTVILLFQPGRIEWEEDRTVIVGTVSVRSGLGRSINMV